MLTNKSEGSLSLDEKEKRKYLFLRQVETLYVSVRRISLVEDKVEDKIYEISYADLGEVSVLREERSFDFNKNSFSVKICEIRIEYGGNVLIIPVKDNANIDSIVEKINKMRETI